ncbi:MAG: hypothetical protein ACI8UQ_000178 [Bacteroidia bacterium]|jgi:hypothetical protein
MMYITLQKMMSLLYRNHHSQLLKNIHLRNLCVYPMIGKPYLRRTMLMWMKPIMKEEFVGLEEKSLSTRMKMDMLKDTKMLIKITDGVITEIMVGTMAGMELITGVIVLGMAITIGLDREADGV